ncbi:MAG: uroporphyrinogen decarboxylase [Spirochaetaceae bacterium]|nr:MAG: uroporphyrinogen decarboxylase [Spirochaetaceae bacterium]
MGLSTEEYITSADLHLRANIEIMERFPEILFFPGFWVERGMAAEPSGFGAKVEYYRDQPPTIRHFMDDIREVDQLVQPNPLTDGLMPGILKQYREILPGLHERGLDIHIVAARGPMTLATYLMGVTDFLIALKTEPALTHRLMRITTRMVGEWIDAQAQNLPSVKGLFILDDIIGFLSEEDYLEFAHPYFQEIFSVPMTVKALHNDTPNPVSFRHIADLGVNIFNFTHLVPIPELRQMVGDSVVLMGNISPLDIMVNGGYQDVYDAAEGCIRENRDHPRFLLSAGGGVSMGTPESSIRAIIDAVSAAKGGST